MNYADGQFVILPYVFPIAKTLKYADLVVYVSIRSFEGEKGCFPSYESIAERAGCSRDYVIDAVKRLEAVKMLKCKRSTKIKTPNRYKFTEYTKHTRAERIPYQFFKIKVQLTINEMGILLCLRHVLLGGEQNISMNGLAKIFGITYAQLSKQMSSLIRKGYIEQKSGMLGKKYMFTDRFKWIYDYPKKPGAIKVNNNSPIIVR